MTRILVAGGAGYIGSHCCKALAGAGFEPVVYDNLSTGHREFVKWGPLVEGDIRDGERLRAVMRDVRPAAVMHFAALALVGESMTDPRAYYDVNLAGGLRLLEAMLAEKIDRIVFSSTCAVYGVPDEVPIAEDAVERPINPYGASKLAFERMLGDFERAYGLRSARMRYFNAAGADPAGEIGEWHESETHLLPLVIEAALGRRPPLRIFGADYPTSDGTAIRDYIHVEDLAAAHLRAAEHLIGGGKSETLNLGTGKGASIYEVVAAVERVGGCRVPVECGDRRPGDPPNLVADPARAASTLGWRATKDLGDIVADAWRWHTSRRS
jgi:UDP-glucose-4-epimerase GalE